MNWDIGPTLLQTVLQRWMARFWRIAGAVNIRIKIMGIVLGLVLLLGFAVTVQVSQLLAQNMYLQLQEQGISIARDLAARATDLILINDLYGLRQLIRDTQINHSGVRYAFVVGNDLYILAHTFEGGFPEGLLNANQVTGEAYAHTEILQTDEGQLWDIAVPIFEGRAGVARVGMSDVQAVQIVNIVTGQLLLTTVLVSAIGITAAMTLTWVLTRPIIGLVGAARKVEQGDFSPHVPVWANDEVGELALAFNAMTAALAKNQEERAEREQLRAQYVNRVIAAQEEERKRIARELHDSTSQTLTSLLIGFRTLSDTNDPAEMRQRADDLRSVAANILDEVHSLALQLRPSVLDDLGLPEAIKRHVAECQKHHAINIDLAFTGFDDHRLPAPLETALYRITQEALTNIIRHAEAETASIFIERTVDKVLAIIEDDGKGFDPEQVGQEGHLGLYGIRERAELLSGRLVIESQIGAGTSLYVEIPINGISKG
jgi:signal transduction histidine kinase